jgi:hypothetical protein
MITLCLQSERIVNDPLFDATGKFSPKIELSLYLAISLWENVY